MGLTSIVQREISALQKDLELYSKAVDDIGGLDVKFVRKTIQRFETLMPNIEALLNVLTVRDNLINDNKNYLQLLQTTLSSELALFSPDWALWAQNEHSLTFMEVKNISAVPSVTNFVTFEFQHSANFQNIEFLCIAKDSGITLKFSVLPRELVKTVVALLKSHQSNIVAVPKMEEHDEECDSNLLRDISGHLPVKFEVSNDDNGARIFDNPVDLQVTPRNLVHENLTSMLGDDLTDVQEDEKDEAYISLAGKSSLLSRKKKAKSSTKPRPEIAKAEEETMNDSDLVGENESDRKGESNMPVKVETPDGKLDQEMTGVLVEKPISSLLEDNCDLENSNTIKAMEKESIGSGREFVNKLFVKKKKRKKAKLSHESKPKLSGSNCRKCGLSFNNRSSLTMHYIQTHGMKLGPKIKQGAKCRPVAQKREIGTCSDCGKTMLVHNLKIHMIRIHKKGGEPSQCTLCPFFSLSPLDLDRHTKRKHSDPAVCNECGFKTNCSDNLTSHMQRVHNEHSYPCDRCDKSFKKRDNLQRHVLSVHENQRQCLCNICGKGFYDKNKLDRHRNGVHLGNRFPCLLCKADFSQKGDLYRHVLKCHPT